MTATGAPEPDDSYLFRSITQDLDIDAAKVAQQLAAEAAQRQESAEAAAKAVAPAASPEPVETPEPAPASDTSPTPSSSPVSASREKTTAPSPQPGDSPADAAEQAAANRDGEKSEDGPPARTIRAAIVDWIDRRGHAPPPAVADADAGTKRKVAAEDEEITLGAFVTVGVITIVVSGLAFALSFDMMRVAARNYGWTEALANLFPVIIDVGAVGGTFMGSISVNATYRRTGMQILIVTLAASVLFNLVGHDIKGAAMLGLPPEWAWTGFVAAILIPLLLSYFVHAFSKALKTFFDQRRAKKAVEQARAEAAEQARVERERQELQKRRERQEQRDRDALRERLAPAPVPRSEPEPARPKPVTPTTSRASRPAPRPARPPRPRAEPSAGKPVTQPDPGPSAAPAGTPPAADGAKKLTREIAMAWASTQETEVTSTDIINHFGELGYELPNGSTVRRWKKKEEEN